jgi:hypothetical protein
VSNCCLADDMADIYNETWQRARKHYKCCECSSAIEPKDSYQRVTMLYDGMWDTYKTCEKCADLRESLADIDCPAFEYLSECYTDNIRPCVKRGTHAAKLVPDYYLDEGGEG